MSNKYPPRYIWGAKIFFFSYIVLHIIGTNIHWSGAILPPPSYKIINKKQIFLLVPIVSNLHIFVTKWIYFYPIMFYYLFHVNFALKYMQISISIVYVAIIPQCVPFDTRSSLVFTYLLIISSLASSYGLPATRQHWDFHLLKCAHIRGTHQKTRTYHLLASPSSS